MRILFAVSAWSGHYLPMVPLGWAAQAAGHEVRVLCSPGEQATVAASGLTPVPALDAFDLVRMGRFGAVVSALRGTWPFPGPPPHPETGEPVADLGSFDLRAWWAEAGPELRARSERSTDAAVRFARRWRPDLVVHDLQSLEGPLVAAVTGVPDIAQLWGPVGTEDTWGPVGDDGSGERQASIPSDPSEAFARHGVPPMSYDLLDRVLDPCPPALRPPYRAVATPIRYVPYNGSGAAPLDLPEPGRRPRVCVVWGNSPTVNFGPSTNRVADAVTAAVACGAEVLVLGRPDDLRTCEELRAAHPDTVRLLGTVPLHLALPGCAAVVHYGGAGAAMTAVAAGVPQLSLPCGYDQPLVAARLTAAGVGLDIRNEVADPAAIGAALGKVLGQDGYAERAATLAAEVRAFPTPAACLETILPR